MNSLQNLRVAKAGQFQELTDLPTARGAGDAAASIRKIFEQIYLDLGEIWANLKRDLGKND